MTGPSQATKLSELLKGQQFCLLTTFRKDGASVDTPMWFALEEETVYMSTMGESAKVKRLRRNARVALAPCDGGGRKKGPQIEGTGQVLDTRSEEGLRGEHLLARRYGIKRRLLMWGLRWSKDKSRAIIAVRLGEK